MDRTLRWTLLTSAKVKIVDEKTVQLVQNGKQMYLTCDSESPVMIKTWSTVPTHDYDALNQGTALVGFEATIPAGSSRWFTATFSATNEKNRTEALNKWQVKNR